MVGVITKEGKRPVCPWCNDGFGFYDATAIVDGETFHLNCAAEDADNAFFDRDMEFGDR